MRPAVAVVQHSHLRAGRHGGEHAVIGAGAAAQIDALPGDGAVLAALVTRDEGAGGAALRGRIVGKQIGRHPAGGAVKADLRPAAAHVRRDHIHFGAVGIGRHNGVAGAGAAAHIHAGAVGVVDVHQFTGHGEGADRTQAGRHDHQSQHRQKFLFHGSLLFCCGKAPRLFLLLVSYHSAWDKTVTKNHKFPLFLKKCEILLSFSAHIHFPAVHDGAHHLNVGNFRDRNGEIIPVQHSKIRQIPGQQTALAVLLPFRVSAAHRV